MIIVSHFMLGDYLVLLLNKIRLKVGQNIPTRLNNVRDIIILKVTFTRLYFTE